MPTLEGKVGVQALSSGTPGIIRQAKTGELMTEQGGRFAEACAAGRLFSIANQAKVLTTAALATAWTGLGIGNPTGSGMRMNVIRFGWGLQIAADDDGAVGLMVAATSLTASLTPVNRLTGGLDSRARATAGQTIATPVLYDLVGSYGTVATSAVGIDMNEYWLYGAFTLDPGFCLCNYATTVVTAAFMFSFLWEEEDA